MANLRISQLTPGNPAQSGDLLPIARSDVNFSITAGSIAALAPAGVTSVGFEGDGTVLSSTESGPVTGSGILSATLNTQRANLILAGPTTGSAATPTFRSLVSGDIPNNAANTSGTAANLSGTPALPNGTTATEQAAGSADSQVATDSYVDRAVATETSRAETAEALLAPKASPTFTGTVSAGTITSTVGTATPGTSPATAGFSLLQNTTPTVTGASTTVALSTSTAPTNVGGNTWRYTLAATETGAGSGAWVNASVTVSGYTGGATGNNGTFIITASTTTTFDVVNASGTTTSAGTPVAISSAVVNSPIIQLAGTVNTGTAGTLNSAADTWSIQNVIGSVVPNPISTLTITHSGSSGQALTKLQSAGTLQMWLGSTAGSGGICTGITGANTLSIGSGTGTVTLYANFTNGGIQAPTAGLFGWGSSNTSATLDTGISRSSAGVVAIGTGAAASTAGQLALSRINSYSADMQGSVSSAPTGIVATNVVVAVGAATATFTVSSTEGFTVGDTVTLSASGWTSGSGLASTTATVASVTSTTVLVLTYVSGGPWVAGTYTAQTGTLTQTGGTSVSVKYATAYTNTPTVVVTPTSNAGAFYISASSTTGFTITYATSGTQTFNYIVMGNPS